MTSQFQEKAREIVEVMAPWTRAFDYSTKANVAIVYALLDLAEAIRELKKNENGGPENAGTS